MSEKKIALLIDAENISVKYVETILNEISEYGVATYKRVYGDFSKSGLQKWNEKSILHSMVQVQQPRYGYEKNSSDIMMVIDAMDILHDDKVEGFCIVSNDSDFTRLINRLCEGGKEVIGMGGKNVSRSLIAACTAYKNLEILLENEASDFKVDLENSNGDLIKSNKNTKSSKVPIEVIKETLKDEKEENNENNEKDEIEGDTVIDLEEIKKAITAIILRKEAKGKTVWQGEIGSQLVNAYPDFDVRNYGYRSLTTFIEDMKEFNTIKGEGNNIQVELVKTVNMISKNEIENHIIDLLQKRSIELAPLGNKIRDKYPTFKVQDYGYSKFERFISSIANIVVEQKGNTPQKQASIVKANKK